MARLVLAAILVTQAACSLAFVPRPPPRGLRCPRVAGIGWPVADLGVAVAAVSFGALRAFRPLCDTSRPCPGDRDWSSLAFGALVAAPFALSSGLGFAWRAECRDREPPPPRPTVENLEADPGI
jgi:hypothetical protein